MDFLSGGSARAMMMWMDHDGKEKTTCVTSACARAARANGWLYWYGRHGNRCGTSRLRV